MKKWVHAKQDLNLIQIHIDRIESITVVDNAANYSPKDFKASISITSAKAASRDYASMSHDELMQLSKKERESIHNVEILRKLNKNELSPQQQRELYQANSEHFYDMKIKDIKAILQKLKECKKFYLWGTDKNDSFIDEIQELGGDVTAKDIKNIIHNLHVRNFSSYTYSYLDVNWNSLLIVFRYYGDYTFKGDPEEDTTDVEVADLELYIKIDIDKVTNRGIGVMSFHHPERSMKLPHADYPIEKE